jgi:hypothetical protein
MNEKELPIIQKTYDLILWYIPHLNRMPRDHRFGLGNRMTSLLYGVLEGLIQARYSRTRNEILRKLNVDLEILRFQTRLLKDFNIFNNRQYEFVSVTMNEIGSMLGGWLRQQGGSS